MANATNLQVYSTSVVTLTPQGGQAVTLQEYSTVTLDRVTNSIAVKGVAHGYTGESPSAPMSSFTLVSNVPATGFDGPVGLDALAQSLVQINMVLQMAGQSNNFNGFVTDISVEHGVDSSAKINIKGRGVFATFQ